MLPPGSSEWTRKPAPTRFLQITWYFAFYFAFCSAAVRRYPTRRGLLQNRNRGREGDWDV